MASKKRGIIQEKRLKIRLLLLILSRKAFASPKATISPTPSSKTDSSAPHPTDAFTVTRNSYPGKPMCARSRHLKKAGSIGVLTMRDGRSEASTRDVEVDDTEAVKDVGKISRRRLVNALLIGAGVGTSIVSIPSKRAKAAAKATANATAVVQTTRSPSSTLADAPNANGAVTAVDSTDQRQRGFAREKANPGFTLPAVGVRPKRVFLVRHGQTDFNKLKICQGRRLNPSLNDEGREQARQLLADTDLDAMVCSPLHRARETAAIVQASRPGTSMTVSNNLNEVDFGGAEGLPQPVAALVLARSYMSWKVGDLEVKAGRSGESGEELQRRVAAAAEVLLDACSEGGQVLAVSHSSMIKFTLATLLDVPLSRIR